LKQRPFLTGGAFIVAYERSLTHHDLFINRHRRLGGSRISLAPLGFAGAKPRLAPALAGRLLADFIACAAQLLLQPGGGGCSNSVLTDTLLQAKNQSL
jgi:hypothetical protein